MLHEFLIAIRDGELQSLLDISRALHISPAMALQMADDLARRGYLQEPGEMCGIQQVTCSDCAAGSACHVLPRHWFLTEKGKLAVRGLRMDN
jgi:hypothetical protein